MILIIRMPRGPGQASVFQNSSYQSLARSTGQPTIPGRFSEFWPSGMASCDSMFSLWWGFPFPSRFPIGMLVPVLLSTGHLEYVVVGRGMWYPNLPPGSPNS